MTTRAEHLEWCKTRAREYARLGDQSGTVGSFMSDIAKWEGGPLYSPDLLKTLFLDGAMFRTTPEQLLAWVDGFN